MKKILFILTFAAFAAPCPAQGMGGRLGLGIRGSNLAARYFATDSVGTELVTALKTVAPETGADTTLYYLGCGAFYNRAVADNVYFQTGSMLAYSTGMNADKFYGQWYLVPAFAGAEVILSNRFGIDFRVHPAEIMLYNTGGATTKSVWSLYGSLGAHYYF
ncbi:MAG: hypothetical protein PHW69_08550 [Elusimicrobiaceae bacterium]|nr:hypothetical protein [Elusimicrobiaceae bacterium]